MATIRVRDWTKERIEEIRDAESHSSHDSVIKALLKDRELAKFAGSVETETEPSEDTEPHCGEKAYEDLTVLSEVDRVDNGIAFLWCPNCGNEIAHVGFDRGVSLSVLEIECQRCLTRLDQHVTVAIEVGYPIEQRVVEGTVEDDLKHCVIDYWDRSLRALRDGNTDEFDLEDDKLLWRYNEYLAEFGWDWPPDVPVIGIEPGETYRNEATGERFDVVEIAAENRNALNDYRVERTPAGSDESETETLTAGDLVALVLSRSLVLESEPSQSLETP